MPIARQSTHVGKRKSTRRPKRGAKVLKNTTRRGAYRPAKKAAISRRLNPLRETKKMTDSDLAATINGGGLLTPFPDPRTAQDLTSIFANTSPMCYNFKTLGVTDDRMCGSSCYMRFLNQKLKVTFPQGDNIPIVPQEAWLYWGWVKERIDTTEVTDAAGNPLPNNPDNVTPEYVLARITEALKPNFNERNDELQFLSKGSNNFTVSGKILIKPRKNTTSWTAFGQCMPGDTTGGAGLPPYPNDSAVVDDSRVYNISWRCKHKIHHEEGPSFQSWQGFPGGDKLYHQHTRWLPYSFIWQPNFAQQYPESDSRLKVSADACCWYSDM